MSGELSVRHQRFIIVCPGGSSPSLDEDMAESPSSRRGCGHCCQRFCDTNSRLCAVISSLLTVCNEYYLAIGMLTALVIGIIFPLPGVTLGEIPVNYVCVTCIFFICGLQLQLSDLQLAWVSYKAIAWGILSILFLTPVIGTQITKTVHFATFVEDDNMTVGESVVVANVSVIGPAEFALGLQVFFSVPATLSMGPILVAQAGGNFSLSVFLMIITVVLGVFTVPFMLMWLTELDTAISIANLGSLILVLCLTVLLPLGTGQALRVMFKKVSSFVDKKHTSLRLLTLTLLIILPWVKISQATEDGNFIDVVPMNLVAIAGYGALMHILFLLLNTVASTAMQLELPVKKAIVIMASHKALPFALTVLSFLPESAGSQGLLAIPCVISHLSFVLIDSIIVTQWAVVTSASNPQKEPDKNPIPKYIAGYDEIPDEEEEEDEEEEVVME